MKVVLINGSPHEHGCTYTALAEVAKELENAQIETEILQLGKGNVHGCVACEACRKDVNRHCAFGKEDNTNRFIDAVKAADGVVVGSPVYYSGPNGALCAVLDKMFYASAKEFAYKPAAAVVSCRRAGSTAALDRLNKYFTISNMPLVTSQYWNMVHGNSPQEVQQDLEGLQIMRALGRNMAWMLQMKAQSERVELPAYEKRVWTNFING